MKYAVVSSKEIMDKEKNPTLCLSPKRYLEECLSCDVLKDKIRAVQRRDGGSIQDAIKTALAEIKCKPIISADKLEKYVALRQEQADIAKRQEEIRTEINKIS